MAATVQRAKGAVQLAGALAVAGRAKGAVQVKGAAAAGGYVVSPRNMNGGMNKMTGGMQ